jgi:hypothetical protein
MISRKTLFSILLGIAGVLIMTWRMGRLPARIVIINQSGIPLSKVAVTTDDGRIDIGAIDNGQTRRVSVNPTSTMRLAFEQRQPYVWASPKGLNAGQSLVLYIAPDGKVDARDRLGSFNR